LPYENQKRRVIFQEESCKSNEPVKNLVIQWRRPNYIIEQDIKCIGTQRADPEEYLLKYGNSLKETHELPAFVNSFENDNCCNSKFTPNVYNNKNQQYFLENDLQKHRSLRRHGSFVRDFFKHYNLF
jgi:hypothetical protein